MSADRDISYSFETNDQYQQFRLVFEEYYAGLCQYAFTFVKDREACEDIVQDIFVRIWEKNQQLIAAGTNATRYYLFTAVRNNCLTHLDRLQRTPVYSLSERQDIDEQDRWADSDPAADPTTDYKARLAEYISQLPPKCKEVFLLSRMGQLRTREVASALGISVKTVENQLWKAMKILRSLARNMHLW